MKTITILLASLLIIGSKTGFADSIELTGNCCPVSSQVSNAALQSHQLLLDQMQLESQTLLIHIGGTVHEQAQMKVISKSDEHLSMTTIQHETENIVVESLQAIAQKVEEHIFRLTSTVSK